MQQRASWIFLFPLAIVSSFVVTSCGSAADSKGADPIHLHMLCKASDDGEGVTCDGPERLAHFTPWVNDALFRPGSTFTLWAVGPTRQHSRLFFSACIPQRWKAPVWKAKAAFMAMARQGATGSQSGLSVPESCRPPGVHAPGINLAVSASASPLQADVWQKLASGSAPTPLHTAIVCDRSDSTQGASCTPTSLLRAFDLWTEGSLLSPNASLSVEVVGPLRDALRPVFSLSVPPDLPVGERVAYALGARIELAHLFAGSVEKYGSTIAEAISTTVRRLRERRGRYQLVLLSDLLQITNGVWNFEAASLPPPNDFLSWLRKTNLAPDLRDIPVLVCGLHTGHFGTNSQTYATRLHDLWQRTFQSLGAPEVTLFSSCDAGFAT